MRIHSFFILPLNLLLSAGQTKQVSINIGSNELALWSLKNNFVVEPGTFIIKVGTSDETFLHGNLTVTA
jgi:beta-glucosidase